MSFRCTACFDKSYDKPWKLQRHIRESSKCFQQLNPGKSATRFQCTSCDHTCSREEDLERHRGKIHPDIVFATATGSGATRWTEEAVQFILGGTESCHVTPSLQLATLLDTDKATNRMERFDSHHSPDSHTEILKRKGSDQNGLSPDHKRVCTEADIIDLGVLSLAGDKETSTPKTTEDKDRPSLLSTALTGRPTAPRTITHNAQIQSTFSFNKGTPQSVSISCSSLGSLFGRPSKRVPELWMTWSSTSPAPASLRSLHSVGMPAPMLESVDEELLLSRGANQLDEPRHTSYIDGKAWASSQEHKAVLGNESANQLRTILDRWGPHDENWEATTTPVRESHEASDQRREYNHHEHDVSSSSEQLNKNPDGTFSIVDPATSIPYPGTVGMEKESLNYYRCEVCGKRYKKLDGLKYHRQHSLLCSLDFKLNPQKVPGMPNNMQGMGVNVADAGLTVSTHVPAPPMSIRGIWIP
jgi:hypothetical protein